MVVYPADLAIRVVVGNIAVTLRSIRLVDWNAFTIQTF